MESEHCRVNREKLTFCWALEPAAATGGAADHSAPCRGDTGDVTPVSGHPAPASRDPAETRERDSVLSSVLDQEPPGADVQTPLPPGQSLSESVVSRVIGEIVRYPSNNYQLQQLVQSSLMVSLIYHLMLPWLFAFFSRDIFWCDYYPLECHLLCQVFSLCSRQPSTQVLSGAWCQKFQEPLAATWHLLQQRASSVESHEERNAMPIFPETIKLRDNQKEFMQLQLRCFGADGIHRFYDVGWFYDAKFYQFSNDLIDSESWVGRRNDRITNIYGEFGI